MEKISKPVKISRVARRIVASPTGIPAIRYSTKLDDELRKCAGYHAARGVVGIAFDFGAGPRNEREQTIYNLSINRVRAFPLTRPALGLSLSCRHSANIRRAIFRAVRRGERGYYEALIIPDNEIP